MNTWVVIYILVCICVDVQRVRLNATVHILSLCRHRQKRRLRAILLTNGGRTTREAVGTTRDPVTTRLGGAFPLGIAIARRGRSTESSSAMHGMSLFASPNC